ncbi:hypothetical protein QBC41DRAFT_219121 [Cercophora samala]|uniref:Uncharacterized protein n=1 Tax=Cercophora samala TaxID=330535 RepID=A0AA39ZI95_9PEZI|nr:hypothetical protein QBC41DRAFT_219121 [Cercophora samala]
MALITMVSLSLLLTLVSPLATSATVSTTSIPNTFSWSQWVEDLIAQPEKALTPSEAVSAAMAAGDKLLSGSTLQRQAWCQKDFTDAPADDAVVCIKYLTQIGNEGANCSLGADVFNADLCRSGQAKVVGSRGGNPSPPSNCYDVARTCGLIFDRCWRADNTVKGSDLCVGNPLWQISITGINDEYEFEFVDQ